MSGGADRLHHDGPPGVPQREHGGGLDGAGVGGVHLDSAGLGIGDRTEHVPPGARKAVFTELVLLWLATLLLIRGVVFVSGFGMPKLAKEAVLAAVPFLFIYMPVALCNKRGVDSYGYRLMVPAFDDRETWKRYGILAAKVIGIILIPWLVGYHFYQTLLFHHQPTIRWPKGWEDAALLVPYHLFYVAIPEEFFYRGYFQTRLNEVFPRKFLIFGAPVGWGLPIACLFFAFGHSVVNVQWWHFATFFPGLMFGWAREKSGGVVAGAFIHAWCNVCVAVLDTFYGLR